jgi:DNA-binding transcriptional regulator WhiA
MDVSLGIWNGTNDRKKDFTAEARRRGEKQYLPNVYDPRSSALPTIGFFLSRGSVHHPSSDSAFLRVSAPLR